MKINIPKKEDIINFFKDNKKIIHKLELYFAICLIVAIAIEIGFFRTTYSSMAIDRTFIVTSALFFVSMHFIIPLKTMYEFIYKKRYMLSIIFLLLVVILGYSGSSINMYDVYIPSEEKVRTEVIGKSRAIRSDEWAVNTPLSLSQNMYDNGKKLPYTSTILRGTDTDMYTVIHAPVIDILTIGKPFTIGYLLGNNVGLSLWWYGRLIALMLVSFEFCMIITKKKKLVSLCGMLMISFAPAVQWWYSNFLPDLLIFAQLALVMINKFLETDKLKTKIASAIGFGIAGVSFIFTFYLAWIIPFLYVYFAIFVWMIWQHRKKYKINKRDIIIIAITILAMGLLGIRYYLLSSETLNAVMNTSYPGKRFEIGGDGIVNIFGYVFNIFTPYKEALNPSEMSTMISFYPIPVIVAVIYMIRNKKGYSFIIPLTLVSILFTIWTFVETNELFAKITLLYMVKAKRITVVLGLIQSYLMIYLLGHINKDDKILKENIAKILAFAFTVVILSISIKQIPEGYAGPVLGFVAGAIVLVAFYLLFNLKEENKNKLIALLIFVSIVGGVTVNPIIKGTDIIYKKPIAQEVQKIVKEDKEALWIVDNYGFPIPNYITANGARTINSTNYYPNTEMIKTLIGEKMEDEEIKEIYNRYAHITINIVKEETKLELMGADHYKINLNCNQVKDLNAKYILSSRDLTEFSNNNIKFEKIYSENGFNIYSVN